MRRVIASVAILALLAAVAPAAVAADNTPPVAVDDPAIPGCFSIDNWGGSYPIPEDWIGFDAGFPGWYPLFGACGPLANDHDADGDALTLEVLGQPAHGQVESLADGFLAYRPDPDYSTLPGGQPGGTWVSDTFTYRVFDGSAYSGTATYRLWLAPVNDPPTFTPGTDTVESTLGDGLVSVQWATDISPGPANEDHQVVSFEVLSVDTRNAPGMFAVDPAIDPDGVLTFTTGSEPGLAFVTVRARDDGGLEDYDTARGGIVPPADASSEVTFWVVVGARPPGPPVAVDDELAVAEDGTATINVLDNDTDPDGDPVSVTSVGTAAHGKAGLATLPGTIAYAPEPDATSADAFSYTIDDGKGGTDTATVHVTIAPVNDVPVAADDTATLAEGIGGVIPVLGNDTDVDGDVLAVTAASGAAHGTLTPVEAGVRFMPAAGYNGLDSFTYTASDGHGGMDNASVAVTISADTDAPVLGTLGRNLPGQAIGSTTVQVRLSWLVTDAGSGVARSDVQEQVNDGTWHTVSLASASSRSVIRAVTVGTAYRYRVRAVDGRGNLTPWKVWPVFIARRTQESSASVAWSGTWTRLSDARYSGGASRRASAAGPRATFTFLGRSIGWVATRSAAGGRAQVRIDGTLMATVDLDTGTTAYRRMVFSAQLANAGTHRIEIRPLGDGRVDVDAFVVLP